MEAKHYYYGLPSRPLLVARTGPPWEVPSGPEAGWRPKELRPLFNHALNDVWEGDLLREVLTLLDSMKVMYTSIDVLRIGYEHPFPPIIWIGVTPGSLSGNDGVVVASKCKELLQKYNVTDVDVEIRESVVIRY
jgi:hypothetical protein